MSSADSAFPFIHNIRVRMYNHHTYSPFFKRQSKKPKMSSNANFRFHRKYDRKFSRDVENITLKVSSLKVRSRLNPSKILKTNKSFYARQAPTPHFPTIMHWSKTFGSTESDTASCWCRRKWYLQIRSETQTYLRQSWGRTSTIQVSEKLKGGLPRQSRYSQSPDSKENE